MKSKFLKLPDSGRTAQFYINTARLYLPPIISNFPLISILYSPKTDLYEKFIEKPVEYCYNKRESRAEPPFIHKENDSAVSQIERKKKMKTLTAIYLDGCPYCRHARMAIQELTEEKPDYKDISIHWIEENKNAADCRNFDYYYAPSFFLGQEKLYEAQPGQSYEEIKAHVRDAFDKTLAR